MGNDGNEQVEKKVDTSNDRGSVVSESTEINNRYQEISRTISMVSPDTDKANLDPKLHSAEDIKIVNEHLSGLTGDRNNLPALMGNFKVGEAPPPPSKYDAYKADVVSKVFDKKGELKDSASIEDIRRYMDLTNAETSAMNMRIQSATKELGDVQKKQSVNEAFGGPTFVNGRTEKIGDGRRPAGGETPNATSEQQKQGNSANKSPDKQPILDSRSDTEPPKIVRR